MKKPYDMCTMGSMTSETIEKKSRHMPSN